MNKKAVKGKNLSKVFSAIFAAAAVLSLVPSVFLIWNVGVWFPAVVFAAVSAVFACFEKIKTLLKTKWRIPMIIAAVLFCACLVFSLVLSVLMISSFSYGDVKNTTVVVLGCQVREDGPSLMLSRRLDAAYEILSENGELYCIVSGGKGENEPYAESIAMKEYLVQKGIDESRIIEENKSLNTSENLINSSRLAKEKGLNENLLVVTDGFHQFRAKILASKNGINTSARSSHPPFYLAFTYWVREWFGICRVIALGY